MNRAALEALEAPSAASLPKVLEAIFPKVCADASKFLAWFSMLSIVQATPFTALPTLRTVSRAVKLPGPFFLMVKVKGKPSLSKTIISLPAGPLTLSGTDFVPFSMPLNKGSSSSASSSMPSMRSLFALPVAATSSLPDRETASPAFTFLSI